MMIGWLLWEFKEKLENLGYKVVEIASTGDEAIQAVLEKNPDVILMDIVLKGNMDGIETAETIHSYNDTPIIYVTAYSDDETIK